ncbi:MAG: cell division protein FtsL [Alphaproteobacteria bacterium]
MIRRATLFWIALALATGAALYLVKHEVQRREAELARLDRAILADQEAIHVLRAEWSYLNDPARLEALSAVHLDLRPLTAEAIGRFADLPRRLDARRAEERQETAAIPATHREMAR